MLSSSLKNKRQNPDNRRRTMVFSPAYKRRIKDAFNEAAANHPTPDRPFVIMNGVPQTPNSIAADVERENKNGRAILEILEFFTRGELDKPDLVKFARSMMGPPRL
jgi:hypothetical protein